MPNQTRCPSSPGQFFLSAKVVHYCVHGDVGLFVDKTTHVERWRLLAARRGQTIINRRPQHQLLTRSVGHPPFLARPAAAAADIRLRAARRLIREGYNVRLAQSGILARVMPMRSTPQANPPRPSTLYSAAKAASAAATFSLITASVNLIAPRNRFRSRKAWMRSNAWRFLWSMANFAS